MKVYEKSRATLLSRMILEVLLALSLLFLLVYRYDLFSGGAKDNDGLQSGVKQALAALRDAEQTTDPYQRCLTYPEPDHSPWPRATIEAFCADQFTPVIPLSEFEHMIEEGLTIQADARLDALLDAYFHGNLPEGALYRAYGIFGNANSTTRQMIHAWLEQSPASAHARTIYGTQLLEEAWSVRGDGVLSDVRKSDLARMNELAVEAIAQLERALELNSNIMPAYSALMNAARIVGQRELVESAYQRALEADETGFYYRAQRMESAYRKWGGKPNEAQKIAHAGMVYVSKNPRMVNLRAITNHIEALDVYFYDLLADHEPDDRRAMRYWEVALTHGPLLDALWFAADTAEDLGNDFRAVEFYSQYLRFSPWHYDARSYRADALVRLGELDWARQELQHLLVNAPQSKRYQRQYARLLLKLEDFDGAEQLLKRMLAVEPDNEWLLHNLFNIYLHHQKRLDSAGKLAVEWRDRMPESGTARMLYAQYLKVSGQPGFREALGEFLKYADESSAAQRKMLDEAHQWLAENPEPEMPSSN